MNKFLPSALAAALVILFAVVPVEAGERKAGDVFRNCKGCPEMVAIPAGECIMGEDKSHRYEKPAHKVTIAKDFAIGKYELTFDEWEACRADGPCQGGARSRYLQAGSAICWGR